eukprot:gene10539-282_t
MVFLVLPLFPLVCQAYPIVQIQLFEGTITDSASTACDGDAQYEWLHDVSLNCAPLQFTRAQSTSQFSLGQSTWDPNGTPPLLYLAAFQSADCSSPLWFGFQLALGQCLFTREELNYWGRITCVEADAADPVCVLPCKETDADEKERPLSNLELNARLLQPIQGEPEDSLSFTHWMVSSAFFDARWSTVLDTSTGTTIPCSEAGCQYSWDVCDASIDSIRSTTPQFVVPPPTLPVLSRSVPVALMCTSAARPTVSLDVLSQPLPPVVRTPQSPIAAYYTYSFNVRETDPPLEPIVNSIAQPFVQPPAVRAGRTCAVTIGTPLPTPVPGVCNAVPDLRALHHASGVCWRLQPRPGASGEPYMTQCAGLTLASDGTVSRCITPPQMTLVEDPPGFLEIKFSGDISQIATRLYGVALTVTLQGTITYTDSNYIMLFLLDAVNADRAAAVFQDLQVAGPKGGVVVKSGVGPSQIVLQGLVGGERYRNQTRWPVLKWSIQPPLEATGDGSLQYLLDDPPAGTCAPLGVCYIASSAALAGINLYACPRSALWLLSCDGTHTTVYARYQVILELERFQLGGLNFRLNAHFVLIVQDPVQGPTLGSETLTLDTVTTTELDTVVATITTVMPWRLAFAYDYPSASQCSDEVQGTYGLPLHAGWLDAGVSTHSFVVPVMPSPPQEARLVLLAVFLDAPTGQQSLACEVLLSVSPTTPANLETVVQDFTSSAQASNVLTTEIFTHGCRTQERLNDIWLADGGMPGSSHPYLYLQAFLQSFPASMDAADPVFLAQSAPASTDLVSETDPVPEAKGLVSILTAFVQVYNSDSIGFLASGSPPATDTVQTPAIATQVPMESTSVASGSPDPLQIMDELELCYTSISAAWIHVAKYSANPYYGAVLLLGNLQEFGFLGRTPLPCFACGGPSTPTPLHTKIDTPTPAYTRLVTPHPSLVSTPVPLTFAATPAPTPIQTPWSTPPATPIATLVTTPIQTPYLTPADTPVTSAAITPAGTPATTPARTPAPTPIHTPVSTFMATPAVTHVSTPALTPAPSPIHTPVSTFMATPA